MDIDDDVLALCYLYKEGDEKNKVLLSTEKLYVVHRRRIHEYELENIKDLGFNHRKIMMPLIVGGIMASLSMVAIFKDVFNPYIVMSMVMAGLGLFYFGWTGQLFFTVTTKIKDYDFSIPAPTENLKAFIEFILDAGLLGRRADGGKLSFYLVFDRQFWESQQEKPGTIKLPEKPFRAYLSKQLHRKDLKDVAIVEFAPLKAHAEVRFLKDPSNGKLRPYVMDDISREAVVRVEMGRR
jgi:hypothetical protein